MVPFPRGPARLTIEHDVDATAVLPTQNRSRTVWTTRSTSPGATGVSEPIPMLEVDLRLAVDLQAILTGRKATVKITRPFGSPVRLSRLTVAVSTDAGTTWAPAPATMTSAQAACITLPSLRKARPGSVLSVRVVALSSDGDSVAQTLYAAALIP